MLCAALIASSLMLSVPDAQTLPDPAPATVIAQEPLYAEIVARAQSLERTVAQWLAAGEGADAAFSESQSFADLRAEAGALAELNMRGHHDLAARSVDGDLKCILRGLAEDIPVRLSDYTAASSAPERQSALGELRHLFEDNAAVVLSPPQPASGAGD